jgi:hypothetical protein
MKSPDPLKSKSFTIFRSAAQEIETKREAWQETDPASLDNEGGHMSSLAGRVMRVFSAELPYVAVLSHRGSETTERGFGTMREAEAYIKRNTPVPRALLSTTYDRPASASRGSPIETESEVNDENILARLKVIDERLRQISVEEAASVLAGSLANAGLNAQERLNLVAETERILDELDGSNTD